MHGLPFCVVLRTNVGESAALHDSFDEPVSSLLILELSDENELFVSSIDVSHSCFIDDDDDDDDSFTMGF